MVGSHSPTGSLKIHENAFRVLRPTTPATLLLMTSCRLISRVRRAVSQDARRDSSGVQDRGGYEIGGIKRRGRSHGNQVPAHRSTKHRLPSVGTVHSRVSEEIRRDASALFNVVIPP